MNPVFRYYLLLLAVLFPLFSLAQVRFVAIAPFSVALDEVFTVEYRVDNADINNFEAPNFTGFEVLSGPNVLNNYRNINGRVQRATIYSFYLRPQRQGKLTIAPARATISGRSMRTQTLSVNVLSSGGNAPKAAKSAHREVTEADLYFVAQANRKKVYEQEAIVVDYTMKVRNELTVDNIKLKEREDFKDFWSQEITKATSISPTLEKKGNHYYKVAPYMSYMLFPQKTGTLHLPTLSFWVELTLPNEVADDLLGGIAEISTTELIRKSNTLSFEVKPLPTPRPKNFTGLVGAFTAQWTVRNRQLFSNAIDTLRIILSGQGNHKYTQAPVLTLPQGIRLYPVKITDRTHFTSQGVTGEMYYDYPFSVDKVGTTVLPAMTIHYFDPKKEKYESLSLSELSLEVAQGQDSLPVLSDSQEKTDSTFSDSLWSKVLVGIGGISVLFVLTGGCWYVWRMFTRKTSPQKRQRKAAEHALVALQQKIQLQHPYCSELLGIMMGYFSDKWQWRANSFTQQKVLNELSQRGVELQTQIRLQDFFQQCDRAAFAPPKMGENETSSLVQMAINLVQELERQL